jgi:hypothetical protein
VFQAERDFSAQTISDNWFTSMLEPGGSPFTPAGIMDFPRVDFGNGLARSTWDANGDPREFVEPDDRYDFAPINYLQVPLERFSAGLLFNYAIAENTGVYSELMYARNKAVNSLAPTGAFGDFVTINVDNPVLTPANGQFLADNAVPVGPNLVGFRLGVASPSLGRGSWTRRLTT